MGAPKTWRSDFSTALALSTFVVAGLTALTAAVGLPHPSATPPPQVCSVTSCLLAPDEYSLLLTYWQADRRAESPRRGLARIDLRDPRGKIEALSGHRTPWRLAAIGSNIYCAGEAAAGMMLQPLDSKGKRDPLLLPGSCTAELASTPDGKLLAALSVGELKVVDVAREVTLWQWKGEVYSIAFHPRCGLIAALPGRIVELSMVDGAVIRTVAMAIERVRMLSISPSGDAMACLGWQGGLELLRLRDGASLWQHSDHGAGSLPPTHRPALFARVCAFSRDGRYLVTAACEGEWVLAVWNTKSGRRIKTLRGHDDTIHGATFLPNGALASWSADGSLRIWDARQAAVRRVFQAGELPLLADSPGADRPS